MITCLTYILLRIQLLLSFPVDELISQSLQKFKFIFNTNYDPKTNIKVEGSNLIWINPSYNEFTVVQK